ncbi:rod shape-determining protein MreD [Variovorax sp. PCZ-1]|uniref:rod shape-determining protein MreD n=1 Tax=Variovorax sp. PCZ-1 TaxID=2835533 RepID=UPI001BD106AF|nr:rod shape-determining protein MreD [Variovorax sp. PCZ-1]MBS7808912.1 rod shape-determining protein MreD [Variovorax sp. PCZ-1]
MIMRSGDQLLLPVNPWYLWGSLLAALMLNVLMSALFGRASWPPDVLALALVFWVIHQPLRVGVGTAFIFGLCMDVHQGALLGQHALAYTALSFFAITISRRLLWYSIPSQALQIFPLLAAAHALQLAVRLLAGHSFPGWGFVIAPVIEALLWPVVTLILLAPQMRAPDPDANRPL